MPKATKKAQSNKKPISIFISYSHDDALIAKALEEEISSIDQTRFDVFLDFKSIELGKNWKTEIAQAVAKADVFIAIFTGNQKHVFDYCGFEVGLFSGRGNERANSMFCVYDTKEPPTILADLQGVPIAYEGSADQILSDENWQSDKYSPSMKTLFQLCYRLYKLRYKQELTDRSEIKSRKVIRAFYANKGDEVVDERPLQERLIIVLPSITDWSSVPGIPGSAMVVASRSTFDVMGIPPGVLEPNKDGTYCLNWQNLGAALRKRAGNIVPWISYVEASVLAQLQAGGSQPPQLSFLGADSKTYRPVLGRFKIYRSGIRRYYVQLIPTLERGFPGRYETSAPLIGLIFAARFWFKFCEDDGLLHLFPDDKADDAFDLEVRALDSYLKRMITEASEYGLADKESMKRALEAKDAPLIDHFFEVWEQAYGALSTLFKDRLEGRKRGKEDVRQAIEAFVEKMKLPNERFMKMVFEDLSIKLAPVFRSE